jgi:hypothetical protein
VSQDEEKSWSIAEVIPKGKAVMVIEHPFDNRYVSLFRMFRMTSADVFMVSRHSRSPIARFNTPLKIVERRGALSKFQYHLLSSPGRCRSIQIPRNGDPYFIRELGATAKGGRHLPQRGMPFSLYLAHNLT